MNSLLKRLIRIAVPLAALTLTAACSHDNDIALSPPYDAGKNLGRVTALWRRTDDERGFAGGERLAEPEVRFQYQLNANNRSGDKIFVRLGSFRLVDSNGLAVGEDAAKVECTLPDGKLEGILRGEVWLPKTAAERVKDFRISSFAVPLDDTKKLREWELRGRPGATAAVDAELSRYAAAPTCIAR